MELNPEYRLFDGNMFVQMRALLEGEMPPQDRELLDMSIGEPQIAGGDLLAQSLAGYNADWQYYPKATGHPRFTTAIEGYIRRRCWLPPACFLLALSISRRRCCRFPHPRALGLMGGLVRSTKPRAKALIANPYYHAWRAARWPPAARSAI